MWARGSHTLATLTNVSPSKMKLKLTKTEQDDFYEIKWIVFRNALLAYPDFNEEFKMHTDASDFQLGAVISHKGKPITFYSGKRKESQKRYTVTEKYQLRIIENLKDFRTILLGQRLRIYTDNKNLTCNFKILIYT